MKARVFLTLLASLLLCPALLYGQQVVNGPFHLAWSPNPEPDIAGYRTIIDNTISDVGNVTDAGPYTVPQGNHVAAVMAYNVAGQVSQPSTPVNFVMSGPADPCTLPGGSISLIVSGYTTPLKGGDEGVVTVKPVGPSPIIRVQIALDQQVVGEITGTQLTWIRSIGFGTFHATGTYNLVVSADDARGCHVHTTVARPLVIQ